MPFDIDVVSKQAKKQTGPLFASPYQPIKNPIPFLPEIEIYVCTQGTKLKSQLLPEFSAKKSTSNTDLNFSPKVPTVNSSTTCSHCIQYLFLTSLLNPAINFLPLFV